MTTAPQPSGFNPEGVWLDHFLGQEDPPMDIFGEFARRNGKGIILNDTYLHDARNDSDEPRALLWLDIRRPMRWYLQLFNILCLAVAHRDKSVKKIRENTLIEA